jgi:glyoxylase-like metal-dependent hydrolase (beta-lactamase superfamily II)
MQLTEITPHIWLVHGENAGRFPRSHSVLIRDERTALIDTGAGIAVLQALREEHPPDLVINTHAHPDHSAGNWLFAGTPIWGPTQTFDVLGRIEPLSHRFVEEHAAPWRAFARREMGFTQDGPPTHAFDDGHRFTFGHVTLEAIFCPGHSADMYCLWEPEQGILLAADIDFTSFGPWYGSPESDIALFEESIRRVWALQPCVVISSHKGVFTDDLDRHFEAFLDVFRQRDTRLLALLERPRTLAEIVEAALIYGRFPFEPGLMRFWEGQMIGKHLARLAAQGRVYQDGRGWRAV